MGIRHVISAILLEKLLMANVLPIIARTIPVRTVIWKLLKINSSVAIVTKQA
jgi:hypothetical protein